MNYLEAFQECIDDDKITDAEVIELAKKIIEKLTNKANRYKTIAYNAITEGQILERMNDKDACFQLGVSSQELTEIMSD